MRVCTRVVFIWLVSTPMFQEESVIAHIAYNIYASATYPCRWG